MKMPEIKESVLLDEIEGLVKSAYESGWIACAGWAERDDLVFDTESPAYLRERKERVGV